MLTKKETREINYAAFAAFISSGKQCVKELETVPPCKYCGRIPRNYARYDDGSIECAADSRIECLKIAP